MTHRILLLSAAFGAGHLQAARALADAARTTQADCQAEVVELSGHVVQALSAVYLQLLCRKASAYRTLYRIPADAGLRQMAAAVLLPEVLHHVQRVQPTAVVATHPFPALALGVLRASKRLPAPVGAALTDFGPHPLWVHAGIDRYFVATEETGRRLRLMGAEADRIRVTGIPVRPTLGTCSPASQPSPSLRPGGRLRSESGAPAVPPSLRPGGRLCWQPRSGSFRHVLVMGGGLGLGPIIEAVRSLVQLPRPDLRITVVCGANQALESELLDLFAEESRLEVLGYTGRVPELLVRSDLLVTKPGGLTCSESLACGVPLLLLPPLAEHEEENAAWLQNSGAAIATEAVWAGKAADDILYAAPDRLRRMREAARLAGRPWAAEAIINEIFTFPSQNHRTGATA